MVTLFAQGGLSTDALHAPAVEGAQVWEKAGINAKAFAALHVNYYRLASWQVCCMQGAVCWQATSTHPAPNGRARAGCFERTRSAKKSGAAHLVIHSVCWYSTTLPDVGSGLSHK